ncbi:MAG: cyclic nucleotide-binding domain-containing protein, partial [Proteobacteria bacterium]|nr:cyclic nucleotide-binding domain-containing protein [Pseudomonadota bacterium]
MAGANKILKAGQMVFKAGEAADGMYLVRKGELVVFLEQDGKQVVLAKIGEGAMIGEMALFDRQPRSASVKASTESEVTLISLDDFGKLMKQIPKWFVGLMTTLSGRLRTTNDRLRLVEAAAKNAATGPSPSPSEPLTRPFYNLMRMVN